MMPYGPGPNGHDSRGELNKALFTLNLNLGAVRIKVIPLSVLPLLRLPKYAVKR